jgi:predicted methyltransferase
LQPFLIRCREGCASAAITRPTKQEKEKAMTTASTFTTDAAANLNTVMHGNCVEIMSGMQSGSIDFVITDPPYITRYCARDGRTVANDDN